MDCAISSSSASITGAVAAMAEPPQIEEPTPTSVAVLVGTFITLHRRKAISSEVEMVARMIGRDCLPFWRISVRFIPKPSSTTAACRIFLEVKVMPGWMESFFFSSRVSSIPARIANTGPPTTGTSLPRNHAGTAIARHSSNPAQFFCRKVFMKRLPLLAEPAFRPVSHDNLFHHTTLFR